MPLVEGLVTPVRFMRPLACRWGTVRQENAPKASTPLLAIHKQVLRVEVNPAPPSLWSVAAAGAMQEYVVQVMRRGITHQILVFRSWPAVRPRVGRAQSMPAAQ